MRVAELLRRPRCKTCKQVLKHENTNQCQARFTFHQFGRAARRRRAPQHLQNYRASLRAAQNPRAVAAARLGAGRRVVKINNFRPYRLERTGFRR